jgi:mono/diheme cytochrome c family protein
MSKKRIFAISLSIIISGSLFLTIKPTKAEDIKIEITPERLQRGKYLAENVAACMHCHSKTDETKLAKPIISGSEGSGGELFGHKIGFPGELYSKNITPYALKDWTDGEIVRAITEGVSKNGKALFPLMPYPAYAKMDKEDIYSIVAYIRNLKPVKNETPEIQLDFPLNILVNFMPVKSDFKKIPDKKDTINYGKYLVNMGACIECHSQKEKGQPIKGKEFGGGEKFFIEGSDYTVISSNITPDMKTGIGTWSKETFISRFKSYNDKSYENKSIEKGKFNTVMPWLSYRHLEVDDLSAVYEYLKTLPAVDNKVENK